MIASEPDPSAAFSDVSADDVETVALLFGVSGQLPIGNGDGNSIFRLREGIERFLITDINNPAASAQGQSEVWIGADVVSTTVEDYNHVPGGSNVLFLDGHVDFQNYDQEGGDPPTNGPVAVLTGAIIGS